MRVSGHPDGVSYARVIPRGHTHFRGVDLMSISKYYLANVIARKRVDEIMPGVVAWRLDLECLFILF